MSERVRVCTAAEPVHAPLDEVTMEQKDDARVARRVRCKTPPPPLAPVEFPLLLKRARTAEGEQTIGPGLVSECVNDQPTHQHAYMHTYKHMSSKLDQNHPPRLPHGLPVDPPLVLMRPS